MNVVGQYGLSVNTHPPALCGLLNARTHNVGVCRPERLLAEPRVPGDVGVEPECTMGHIVGG